jgi:hypothetical protein
VDVEEVLKENKEKEAAAKKERDRQRHQMSDGNSSDGEGIGASMGGNLKGQMEVPKDRTQLANMRVIRRNLVYAVGLPASIASEDTLRKSEYFGQYGKISKIVLNRSQTTGGDLRRASASAYVTFVHKVRIDFQSLHLGINYVAFGLYSRNALFSGGHLSFYFGYGWILLGGPKYSCFVRYIKVLFCFHQECPL